jgi:hypothetical protein
MKVRRPPAADGALPVDPARLRQQFPSLTDADVAAFEAVTRRILSQPDPVARARVTREVLARGRAAREQGAVTDPEDRLAQAYLDSVEKMQRK